MVEVKPNLMAVDGVDGAGSSTIADELRSQVGCYRDCIRVDLPRTGYYSQIAKGIRAYEARTGNSDHPRIALGYMKVTRFVFQTVIKPLLEGRPQALVVTVSNDVKNLTHAVNENYAHWVRYLISGVVTAGIRPKFRILVDAPGQVIQQVVADRLASGQSSKYDPVSKKEVAERRQAFSQACKLLAYEKQEGVIHYPILNDRKETPKQLVEKTIKVLELLS